MRKRILAVMLMSGACAAAADDVVTRAMKDELARSMQKLQLENLQKPYFAAYRMVEQDTCSATASFGAIVTSSCEPVSAGHPRTRQMSVELRVGDYARDNTNFYAFNLQAGGVFRFSAAGGSNIPVDDNYDEIRRQLWVATDSAYKNALDVYAKKKAALEHRTRTDDAPDFSKEAVVTDTESMPPVEWNRAEIEGMLKQLSALFRTTPNIQNSEVRFQGNNWNTRYLNSEGTQFTRQNSSLQILVVASTQAVDGMPLSDFEVVYARSLKDLPSKEELTKRIRDLQARLDKLRTATLVERYTGPVLFEGQAAGELVGQGLANALLGVPRLVVDDSRFERVFASDDNSFADKIGNRVLPDFLTLTDNATLREYKGAPLFGGYQVDDDGVKPVPTTLIDKGYVKLLLHTRALIPNTTASTGSRRGPGPMPSNLVLSSDKGIPADQLKAKLIEMVKQRGKEFGILVRKTSQSMYSASIGRPSVIIITRGGAAQVEVEPLIEAYKVYPDGREELVRNLNVNGLTLANFKDIVAVSDTAYVHTTPFRPKRVSPVIGGLVVPAGQTLVSVATPALLFEDLTLQRPTGDVPNLPVTKHPSFERE